MQKEAQGAKREQGQWKPLARLQRTELGILPSVSLCSMKALQIKGNNEKIIEKQILTNSSGENFRFHYRKSNLFNVENVKIGYEFSINNKNWKSSLQAFVIFLFCWDPLKKKKTEALPTRKPLISLYAPTRPVGRTLGKNFFTIQRKSYQR